jgi:hypothetical protein
MAQKDTNADFWGYLEGAQQAYIPVLSPRPERSFAAQDCRAIIARAFNPSKSNIERNGTAHENTLVLSSLIPRLTLLFFHYRGTGCDCRLCARLCSIRGQEVSGWPRFPGTFRPSVCLVRRDSREIIMQYATSVCRFSCYAPRHSRHGMCFLHISFPHHRVETGDRGQSGVGRGRVTVYGGRQVVL